MTAAVLGRRKPLYYYGWTIVGACILSQLASLGVTVNCFSLFLGDWTREFHTPISSLAFGVTLFSLCCSLFTIPSGLAADRFPARQVIGLGLAGVALAHLLIGFAQSGWQIIAIYVVVLPVAICFSAAIPCQAVVSRWFVRRRGTAMGLCAFGLAMAGVVFPPIITLLVPAVGWRATWWLFGGLIALVLVPVVYFLLRDAPTAEEGAAYLGPETAERQADITIREVFARRNFWAIVGVFLPVQCVSMVAGVNMAPLVQQRGLSLQTAGLLLSAYSVAALVGKFASGVLADRLGSRVPFALVAVLAAGGVALLGLSQHAPLFFAAAVMIGLSQGHWTLLATATASEFGPQAFGRAYGVISALTPIGSLAPPVVAYVFEHGGGYAATLAGLAFLSLGGGVVAMTGFRRVAS